jgi:lipopolysaccharide/colanic/teichoic acid biosynthesis glycosyltransferase
VDMKSETLKTMITLSSSAFGLVAALAWNSAITEVFKRIFGSASSIIGLFVYAIVVTVIAVIVTTHLGRAAQRVADSEKKQ